MLAFSTYNNDKQSRVRPSSPLMHHVSGYCRKYFQIVRLLTPLCWGSGKKHMINIKSGSF